MDQSSRSRSVSSISVSARDKCLGTICGDGGRGRCKRMSIEGVLREESGVMRPRIRSAPYAERGFAFVGTGERIVVVSGTLFRR